MARRAVIVLLTPVRWHPPGVDPAAWRAALAEDVVDMVAALAETEAGIAAVAGDRGLAAAVAWPAMRRYEVSTGTVGAVLAAAAADGYEQAVVLAADVPDLPGLLVGKLLRPLTSREVAVAPALGGAGLVGLAARLPAPDWLVPLDLDSGSVSALRASAPSPAAVAVAPGWRRMRGPTDLASLDGAVDGWDATRTLLSA